jgi:prepilin-type processing-associated H-X9-DG protein
LGVALNVYVTAREGKTFEYNTNASRWLSSLVEEAGEGDQVRLCPEASRPTPSRTAWGTAKFAWSWYGNVSTPEHGSYGFNGFFYNPEGPYQGGSFYCGQTPYPDGFYSTLEQADSRSPVFGDCNFLGGWPTDRDRPPRDYLVGSPQGQECGSYMGRYCLDRHDFAINVGFADAHVERVGLEWLWDLQWSRVFERQGENTKVFRGR